MEDEPSSFTTNEEAQATTRVLAAVLLLVGVAIAYWLWPSGITDLTLNSMTFGQLLRAIGSGAVVVVSLVLAAMLWI